MSNLKYKRIAFTGEAIQNKVTQLGAQIKNDYEGEDLVLVSVLKGSTYFFADLTRAIDLPIELDFMAIGVYPHATAETGAVRITKDLDIDISGKHVLVIEDIIRTGLTIGYLVQNLKTRQPKSVKVATLLINHDQQLIDGPIAYEGFQVTDTWLMGYGMDIEGKWRNLPYIVEITR